MVERIIFILAVFTVIGCGVKGDPRPYIEGLETPLPSPAAPENLDERKR